VRAGGNADGPADAEISYFADWLQVVIEHLIAEVGTIGDPDVARRVDLQAVGKVEFPKRTAGFFAAGLGEETTILVVLHDAVVAVAVGDEDVALRIPANVGGAAESIFLRGEIRAGRRWKHSRYGRGPSAQHHQHPAFGTEFGDHVGAFVDGPDVVVFVDADGVGELEPDVACADFLQEFAGLVEFEKARAGAAMKDEDVAFGVCCYRDGFAQLLARWKLQEIRYGGELNFRNVLDGCFTLCEGGPDEDC